MVLAVQARNLSKEYSNGHAVQDLSLQVDRGEILAFLGQNGSGKSTTLKMLAGILEPTSGEILICGERQAAGNPATKWKIGVLPEEIALVDVLTARENLLLAAPGCAETQTGAGWTTDENWTRSPSWGGFSFIICYDGK